MMLFLEIWCKVSSFFFISQIKTLLLHKINSKLSKEKMISFVLSLVALVLGYLFYGRLVERVFGPDDRVTPAVAKADGLDYIVLPSWKIFMINS